MALMDFIKKQFIDILQWTGTRDFSAHLAVPTAIEFLQENQWDQVRVQCHALLRAAIQQVCNLTGLNPLYPLDSDFYHQMGIAPLPKSNLAQLKRRLYDEFKVEVPLIQWQDRQFVRISIQAYNSAEDVDALIRGLSCLLPEVGE